MLNSKVSHAVAAVLALGAAAGAHAVDMSTVPPTNVIRVSGSTAIDPALIAYLVNSTNLICDASRGAIDFYQGTSVTNGKFLGVACAAGSGITGVAPGTSIAILKEDNAGSNNGIVPVDQPTANFVSFPVVTDLDSAHCPAGATTTPFGEQTQTAHKCSGYAITTSTPTSGPYSNLGFADVEAGIFGENPTNTNALSTVDVPFGAAVSLGLYHALQRAEGISPQDDDVSRIPNLNRAQLAAIFNGQLSTWTKVTGSGGTVASQSVVFGNSHVDTVSGRQTCYDGTAFSTAADCQGGTNPPTAHTPSSSTIYFCQRGQSSGTQQTAQIYFANKGCAGGVLPFTPPSKPGGTCAASGCGWSTTTYGSAQVFAGNGTGDDLSCLEAHDGEGHFAVSFAGTDAAWGADSTNTDRADWRFIKVQGVVPSIENAASGKYLYWAQSAGYYPASTSAVNYPASGTVAAALEAYFTNSSTQIGASAVPAIDHALQRTAPAFDGGVLAIPGNGGATPNPSTASVSTFRGNPVNSFLKENPSNNCQQAYLAPNAPDTSDSPSWATP